MAASASFSRRFCSPMIALHTVVTVREIFSRDPDDGLRQSASSSAKSPFSGRVFCPVKPDTLAFSRLYHCAGKIPATIVYAMYTIPTKHRGQGRFGAKASNFAELLRKKRILQRRII